MAGNYVAWYSKLYIAISSHVYFREKKMRLMKTLQDIGKVTLYAIAGIAILRLVPGVKDLLKQYVGIQ
jgi:hypothetical protein